MERLIMRKPNGELSCDDRHKSVQYSHISETFTYAISRYGFLIKHGEGINGAEWLRRINEYHAQNCNELEKIIDSVNSVMLIGEMPIPRRYKLDDSLLSHFIKWLFLK